MLYGLIKTGWDIDLHVISCGYFNEKADPAPLMKSATTKDLHEGTVEDKVALLMSQAAPTIDFSTKGNDADERCNQSLQRAWSELPFTNMVNVSMVISNEDGCARSEENLMLPNLNSSMGERNNCAPVTHGQLNSSAGFTRDDPLFEKDLEVWTDVVTRYSNEVWLDQFFPKIQNKLIPNIEFVNFLNSIEEDGKKEIDYFSHFYIPIVVDTNVCLAKSLRDQALFEKENYIGFDAFGDPTEPFWPENTVGNIGYSYLDTYELLDQETLFDREGGDLSLCNDLSQVVGKIENEIKLRGRGLTIQLPRQIDLKTTQSINGSDFSIISITRPFDSVTSDFIDSENSKLNSLGLKWSLSEDRKNYSLNLSLNMPFINYNPEDMTIEVLPNSFLSVFGGDTIKVLEYYPVGFETEAPNIDLIGS